MKKITLLASFLFITAFGYAQIFLEVSGLKTDDPQGQPVLAYSFGVSNSGSTHVGGGMGAGKANFQDLSLTIERSRISLALLKAVATGKHFDVVKLNFFVPGSKTGTKTAISYRITLSEVLVTSYSTGASCGTKECDVITENLTFNFAKIKIEDLDKGTSMDTNIAENTTN